MAETTTKTIILPNEQEVTVTREINDFYVSVSRDLIKVKVFNIYNGKNVKTEFYQFPASEVMNDNTGGDTFYNEIKAKLWDKIKEIDNIDISTEEGLQLKAERYGHGWNIRE